MENLKPKISIITVSLNQDEYIEENILSVIDQKYKNTEHLVIDGGSTDNTLSILEEYQDSIIATSEPDNGQSDALNKGFRKATGEIIGWINSDDKLSKGALDTVAEYFSHNPDSIALVGNLALIDQHGKQIKIVNSTDYTKDYLVNIAKGITQQSIFFKRSVFEKIGFINEDLNYVMDRDFFIRVASLGTIYHIPKTLAEFRLQPDSKTSQGAHLFCRELLKVRRKYGGKLFSPGMRTDLYMILTEPLRRVTPLRNIVRKAKGL